MKKELKELLQASKEYITYQSIGNGAKLNCAIENAEKALGLAPVVERGEQCCSPTDGFYLGTTCPRCNKPFRKDIK